MDLRERDAIRNTAIAAGFVWTAPAVKSVRVLGSSGTPAPPTSGTTPPTTVINFGGSMTGIVSFFTVTVCGDTFPVFLDGDLTGLGGATSSIEVCFDTSGAPVTPFPIVGGAYSLALSGGGFSGPVTGGTMLLGAVFLPNNIEADIAITEGAGDFAGATGTAHLSVTATGNSIPAPATGTLTGTVTVPS